MDLQVGFLKEAAFAISSSLTAAGYPDRATQSVVRLLLPFAKPSADPSIVATLGQTLERYSPGSDEEAMVLIDLCRRLVERKSVLVLEGCVSMALSRHRMLLKDARPGGAVHWLLVGMEMEASLYAMEKDGDIRNWQKVSGKSVCYRQLVIWCNQVTGAILTGVLEHKEGSGTAIQAAGLMMQELKKGPLEGFATNIPEVRTMELALGIYNAKAESDDWTAAATCIRQCLEEQPNKFDEGIVAPLAPKSMHWELVRLGLQLVEADEIRKETMRPAEYSPFFDVKGVQVLLEQLAIIPLGLEVEGKDPLPADLVGKMRRAFAKALMRAFVAENAKRKKIGMEDPEEEVVSRIRSVHLHKHSLQTQERVVRCMLDF